MDNVYLLFARRWWWIVCIGAIIAVVVVDNSIRDQPTLYRSQVTIQVGRTTQDKFPDQNQFAIIDRLTATYAELVKRDPILDAAVQALDLPLRPANVRARMVVIRTPNVPLIDIALVDTDPQRASALANEIARQMVLQTPSVPEQDAQTQGFIRDQLTDLQNKITRAQAEVSTVRDQIATMTSAAEIENANRRATALQGQIDSWQAAYASLVASAEPSPTNLITIVSPAIASSTPLPKGTTLNYALALVIGAGLATILALALEMLNRAITSPEEAKKAAPGLPIAAIPRFRAAHPDGKGRAIMPSPDAAAAYRSLRNTLFMGDMPERLTLAVTSTRIGEGKTTTAVNLAVTLANAGRSVILVDANVRNPELAHRFGIAPIPGFSDLVLRSNTLEGALQPTEHEHLRILTAGTIPAGYENLLSLGDMAATVSSLARAAEVVVFDTAAVGEEHDILLLAKHMTSVLLVAEAGRIEQRQIQETLATLQRAETRVVAVVLNKIRPSRFSLEYLPWSREARNRARARQRRQAHGWERTGNDALRSPGD